MRWIFEKALRAEKGHLELHIDIEGIIAQNCPQSPNNSTFLLPKKRHEMVGQRPFFGTKWLVWVKNRRHEMVGRSAQNGRNVNSVPLYERRMDGKKDKYYQDQRGRGYT